MISTKVENLHLDKLAYDLGSEEPKRIATRIIVELNSREKFKQFFDINSDQKNKGIIDSGMILTTLKKMTNLTKIKQLENPRTEKTKAKKSGYEQLFNTSIFELSEREKLVEQGVILLERYFNEIFSVFKYDKPQNKKEPNTSFLLAKFWRGWIDLLIAFLDEGADWKIIRDELKKIRQNVMVLRGFSEYNTPLFQPDDDQIPDASHTQKKVLNFLNQNRKEPTSIQKS